MKCMKNKMKSNLANEQGENDTMSMLDKLLEIEKEKNKVSIIKIIICLSAGVGVLMIVGLLCYRLIKTDFSVESILSTLLAFFSIFIAIFFYFKADETSTNFYKSSYDFMKDVSVTLGKIEERFGEKLNSLDDKVSRLDRISSEKSEEIQERKDDKDKIINNLMDKAKLDSSEREKIRKQLEEKDIQIEKLKKEQYDLRKEAESLQLRTVEVKKLEDRWMPSEKLLVSLLYGERSNISESMVRKLKRLGYIDEEGNINEKKIRNTLYY